MRSPTFATLLCIACALPAFAQDNRPVPRGAAPPAAAPGKPAEPASKDEGGFWNWLRGKDASAPRADRVEVSDRVQRPERLERPERIERIERVERPDRPDRASGGCCQ